MSESNPIKKARERTLAICEELREECRKLLRVALELRLARPDEPIGTTAAGTPLTAENWMSDVLKDFAADLRCVAWELRRNIRRYHRGDVVAVLRVDRMEADRRERAAARRQKAAAKRGWGASPRRPRG